MPEINVRLLADPALAYVADAREDDLMKVLDTLGLSPRVAAWVIMRKEKPQYFLRDGCVEYVLARDEQAESGLCVRVVPVGMYEEAFSAADLVEMYDTRVDGVALGDLTLGPAEFSFGGGSGFVEVDTETLPVCDEYQPVQEKAPAASIEHAILVAEDDPEMVCELPGYCYLKHFHVEDRLGALRVLRADPSLQRIDEYVAGSKVRGMGPYERARLAAVKTTTGWHVVSDSRGDVGMLSPSEKVDAVLGRDAAWTNLVRPEFAEKFLSMGRAVTVQDMEACDSSWLHSDVVLWSHGIVRDAGVWYILQCDGKLPAWAGKMQLDSIVGRDEEVVVGSWAAPPVEGTRYFRVTIWSGQVGCDVEELVLSGSEACTDGDGKERFGPVVRVERPEVAGCVPVTPLLFQGTGARVTRVSVGYKNSSGAARMVVGYERSRGAVVERSYAALVPFLTVDYVQRDVGLSRITNWVFVETDGFPKLGFKGGGYSGSWMVSALKRTASSVSVVADVKFVFNVGGKISSVCQDVNCLSAIGLYGPIVDAAMCVLVPMVSQEQVNGRKVDASVDIEVFSFKFI